MLWWVAEVRLCSLDQVEIPTGRLWAYAPVAESWTTSDVPVGFHQANHVRAAASARQHGPPAGGWMAAVFERPEAPDRDAVATALSGLVSRHPTLQDGVVLDAVGVPARRHHRGPYRVECVEHELPPEPADRRAVIHRLLDQGCAGRSWPAYQLLVIEHAPSVPSRSPGATVLCGLDHTHSDAVSMAVLVRDLEALLTGQQLAPVGSYPDHCIWEASRDLGPDDTRLRTWHDFLDRYDGGFPASPFPTGLAPGQQAPARVEVTELLDPIEAQAQTPAMFASVVAAMALALAETGLADGLHTITPTTLRVRPEWAEALGWFVGNAPLQVPAGPDWGRTRATALDQIATVRAIGAEPLASYVQGYPPGLRLGSGDLFMLSWLDYRRLPGAAALHRLGAVQVSATARDCDGVQLWASRTFSGAVALRVRRPDTREAAAAVGAWVEATRAHLRAGAGVSSLLR